MTIMRASRLAPVALLVGLGVASCELVYTFDGYQGDGGGHGADATVDVAADTASDRYVGEAGDVVSADRSSGDGGCDSCVQPITLSPAPYGGNLVGDDASLYWLSYPPSASRSIMRTDKNDGGTTVLVQDAGSMATGLTVDGTRVYWTTRSADGGLGGTVQTIGKNGQGAAVLASATDWRPTALAVDGTAIYVENPIATGSGGLLSRFGKDGGARITMVTGVSGASATVDEALAVDGVDVYYLHQSSIYRVPKSCPADASSCAPVQVMLENDNSYDVYSFTIDATQIYWTMAYGLGQGSSIHPCGTYAVTKSAAPAPQSEVVLIPACGSGCSVDTNSVYAITVQEPNVRPLALYAAPLDGGNEAGPITGTQLSPRPPIVADGVAVYWIDGIDSSGQMAAIMKLPRP